MREMRCPDCGKLVMMTSEDEQPPAQTLRDQFAMAALTGILDSISLIDRKYPSIKYAQSAYQLADAMLKAREEK